LLLGGGANAKIGGPYGWTPLHDAAWSGHGEIVELLLDRGANVNARGGKYEDYHTTPLHLAAREGHSEITTLLLNHGADLNAEDSSGDTPLLDVLGNDPFTAGLWQLVDYLGVEILRSAQDPCAVTRGRDWQDRQLQIVKLLLDHGADINAAGVYADTPLHAAAGNGNKPAVELLLARGADINARNQGRIWYPEYHEYGATGQTPLMVALRSGYLHVARFLIDRGADVNAQDGGGETPLLIILDPIWIQATPDRLRWHLYGYYARDKGRPELEAALRRAMRDMIRQLLTHGAKANPRNQEGNTPLLGAAQFGDAELAELLLIHGADVEARDKVGATPLHYAARGHKGIVELLLKHGAHVNVASNDGDTPLHEAALRGHKDIVALLLVQGADVNMRNSRGRTPLDTALLHDYTDIVRLLKEAQAPRRSMQKQE